jgi:single-stranded DNA-binding protein
VRGLNKVILTGNVTGPGDYDENNSGLRGSFQVASDRHNRGDVITAYVRVNVFIDSLARACQRKLAKGTYVIVEGELMNRQGSHEKLTEVRARQVIFME